MPVTYKMDRRIVFVTLFVVLADSYQPLQQPFGRTSSKLHSARCEERPRLRVLCSIAKTEKPVGTSTQIKSPVFGKGECAYTGITLTRYMRDVSRENPELRDLEDLISGIQQAT